MSDPATQEAASTERQTAAAADETRSIGRGALYLSLTKIYFILSSYVIYFGLPRVVGGGEAGNALLGNYKAAGTWLSVISTVLVTGTMQAVSRFVGQERRHARAVKRRALAVQMLLGPLIAGGYLLLAPAIARDGALVTAMRISAGIPLVYALYSVLMGTLNGQRRFGEQALMDGGFTTLKVVLVLAGAAAVGSAEGAYAGFLAAALGVFALTLFVANRGHGALSTAPAGAPGVGGIVRFQVQTVGFMFCVQWIVQQDLWYTEWFGSHGGGAAGESSRAVYTAIQVFSQVSYSLVIAVTFVLFPLISAASLKDDPARARGYIREALRYALVIVVGVASMVSPVPRSSIAMLVDLSRLTGIEEGAVDGLRWLSIGYVAFSLFFILCSVINAFGRPRASIMMALAVAGLQVGLGAVLVPDHGLVGQAVASMIAMLAGFVLVAAALSRLVGPVIPGGTLLRVLVAGGTVYALNLLAGEDTSVVRTLARFVSSGAAYLALVLVLREFKAADFERFRKVLRR